MIIVHIPYHVRLRIKERNIKCSNVTNLVTFYINKIENSKYIDMIEKDFAIRDFNKKITIFCSFNRKRSYLRISSMGEIDEIYPKEGEFTIMFYENGTISSRVWVNTKKEMRIEETKKRKNTFL